MNDPKKKTVNIVEPDDGTCVLENEEMWSQRVIDEHRQLERSSQIEEDTSSEDAE